MSWLAIFMFAMMALALVTSFVILVFPDSTPLWLIYASYPISALGGGAAINMILHGIPK